MGTSTSSSGPKGNVPYHLEQPIGEKNEIKLTPARRFQGAKLNLGKFIDSGNEDYLKKALGHYIKKGMGGGELFSQRMKSPVTIAADFLYLLENVKNPKTKDLKSWLETIRFKKLSIKELQDEIIRFLVPEEGSLDANSLRNSISESLSELLIEKPEVDLLELEDQDITFVIEDFLTNEIVNRILLDIGQITESKKYSPTTINNKISDLKNYVKSAVAMYIFKNKKNGISVVEHISSVIEKTSNLFVEEL